MQPTVLIADDTIFMRFVLRELLDEIPLVRIAEAGSLEEAEDLATALSPDLAVVDTTTEKFDGCELIRRLVVGDHSPRVVAIIGIDDLAAELAAKAAGAEAVMICPFDPDVVLTIMENMLQPAMPV